MYCDYAGCGNGAMGFGLAAYLYHTFNFCKMKYYYYVTQWPIENGFTNQCGAFNGDFFDWNQIKIKLLKNGAKNPILTFFKEVTHQEYLYFVESFKR